ncbi:hypothetical protein ACIP4Y_12770 [Streptomyces sp. NPDC088810]|uniref:hypothetical protein n=1 Tax=Streptomyces sp. NPDC088810 TaxID=3365904 RepID=UPI00381C2446
MPVVAGQPARGLGERGPQPVHAEGVPQQSADLLVLDLGVDQDRQDFVQQGLPPLAGRGPGG